MAPFEDIDAASYDLDDGELDTTSVDDVVEDLRQFFMDPQHRIYQSKGTRSNISPTSVYHVGQLEVLFEDTHFHFRTAKALRILREEGFLSASTEEAAGNPVTLVWRKGQRYMRRQIKSHIELITDYSSERITKASGSYAETLVHLGFAKLGLEVVSRNSRDYAGTSWTATDHDLDFIFRLNAAGIGVEVKNTWKYIPPDELAVKIRVCRHLGIMPVFVVRHRHSGQWKAVRKAGGTIYLFKSKILPPGEEELARRIWEEMRLPVATWNELPGQFARFMSAHFKQEPGESS